MSGNLIKLLLGVIIVAVLGFGAFQLFSPGEKKVVEAPVTESGYLFYYYPKLNIYYDVVKGNFVYSVDGGYSWQTKKPASDQIPETISEKVTFYSPVPETWLHNEEHRKRYNGVLTSYVEKPEDTATITIDTLKPVTKKPLVKKPDPKIEEEPEEKKKGFFKRLREKLRKKDKNKDSL